MKSALNSQNSGWVVFFLVFLFPMANARSGEPLEFKKGDRVVFLGGTLAERAQYFGSIEKRLQSAFPE